jgi:hypothetical protein
MFSGIILITVPTIQYGGYFLLTSLMNKTSGYADNPLRQNFFRAGHAHAGVIVILSLLCQILADAAALPSSLLWVARIVIMGRSNCASSSRDLDSRRIFSLHVAADRCAA